MAMDYFKVKLSFRRHPKVLLIKDDHDDHNEILMGLQNLWAYCMESSQDGSLGTSIRRIERAAEWTGKKGRLIEVLTEEDTIFIDVDDDGNYSMHNWYKHNPKLKPERKDAITRDKSKAARIRWFNEAIRTLEGNGVFVDTCKWLNIEEKGGHKELCVDLRKLPKEMYLDGKYFEKPSWFETYFNNTCDKKDRGKVLGKIKKYTKRCKCGTIFINEEHDKCFVCQGK